MAEISRVLDANGNIIGMKVDGVLQKRPYPGQTFIENRKQTEEAQTMSRQVRLLRIPKMAWGKGEVLERVKAHLTALHGERGATERLREMTGLEVLTLSEELKSKGGELTTTGKNGQKIRVLQTPGSKR